MKKKQYKQSTSQANTDNYVNAKNPRLMTRAEAAQYCRLTPSAFSSWVKQGYLPGPIHGTARWDSRAIDAALDLASGLTKENNGSNAFDQWRSKRAH